MSSSTEPTDSSNPTAYHKALSVFEARKASQCCSHLIPPLRPDMTILDVGCGPGSITIDLARLVPQGRVIGLDIWPEALSKARAAAETEGVTNVTFFQGDIFDIPAALSAGGEDPSSTFDVVHAHMILMHLTEPVRAIGVMRKFAKAKGGIVAIADSSHLAIYPELPRLVALFEIFRRIMKDQGMSVDGGRYNHVWAHEAGWPWERIESSMRAYEYSGVEGRRLLASGGKNSIREAAVKGEYATEEECDGFVEAWEEWEAMGEGRHMLVDGRVLCWN